MADRDGRIHHSGDLKVETIVTMNIGSDIQTHDSEEVLHTTGADSWKERDSALRLIRIGSHTMTATTAATQNP